MDFITKAQIDFPEIPWSEIDPFICGLIYDLNVAGYKTLYSCQGERYPNDPHGNGEAYITFSGSLPDALIESLTELGLGVRVDQSKQRPTVSVYSNSIYQNRPLLTREENVFKLVDGVWHFVETVFTDDKDTGLSWPDEEVQLANRHFEWCIRFVFEL